MLSNKVLLIDSCKIKPDDLRRDYLGFIHVECNGQVQRWYDEDSEAYAEKGSKEFETLEAVNSLIREEVGDSTLPVYLHIHW